MRLERSYQLQVDYPFVRRLWLWFSYNETREKLPIARKERRKRERDEW